MSIYNTYIMMRFYDGGGLADYKIVTCEEELLIDYLITFEEECARQNLGTHIGVLDLDEFNRIGKELK